jgi:hypothetical protein
MNYDCVPPLVSGPPPKVSVVMVTYQHETFIAQAINSVLAQRTTFPVELIIGEDCSPDGTRQSVMDFQRRNPDRIRVLLWRDNVGAAANFVGALEACRGEYIAFCEGDDYWTDPDKLQRQVDLLDSDSELALCHHLVEYVQWDGGCRKVLQTQPPESDRGTRHAKDLIGRNFIQTCSLMVRRSCLPVLDARYLSLKVGDWPLWYLAAEHGAIAYLDASMADYRIHGNNSWHHLDAEVRHIESVRMCIYLASVAQPGARAAWQSAGLSMLKSLNEQQPTFTRAIRQVAVFWRAKCLTFPQAVGLLACAADARLQPVASRIKVIGILRKLYRSIYKRSRKLALSANRSINRFRVFRSDHQ